MMCCKNILFVILILSIGIGNGKANENLDSKIKGMENNFLKMNQAIEARMESNFWKLNQAIEARMEAMENNFLKMSQAIEHIWLKLDSGNNPTDEGLVLTQVIPVSKMNDNDLETRVQALEIQMENVQGDVSNVETEVTNIEGEITNIEGEITNIEGVINNIEGEITIIHVDVSILSLGQLNQDEKIDNLEDVSEGLDTRVTTLEDEDGSDESVTEAINQLNSDVQYLNGTVEVLQSADIELDSRLETLEELDVNSEIENLESRLDALELDGTVAFHVGFTDTYPVIPIGGVAVWDYIFFNLGDGYNSVTGEFGVPAGGAGLYYFNINIIFDDGERQWLNIRHNGEDLCTAYEDNRQSGDYGGSACGAVVQLAEGDTVKVYHWSGSDDTPCEGVNYSSTFGGFRIAPA